MTTSMRTLAAATLGFLALLFAAASIFTGYYQDRGLPQVSVAGQPITGLTRAEVREALEQRVEQATISWVVDGDEDEAPLSSLGYQVDVDKTVADAFDGNSSLGVQLEALIGRRDVPVALVVDPGKADAVAADMVEQAGLLPVDAQVALGADGVTFDVVAGAEGKTVDPASFQDEIAQAAETLSPANLTVTFVSAPPVVSDDEAAEAAAQAQVMVALPVTVSDAKGEHSATDAEKASWVTFTVAEGTLHPQVDPARLTAWLDALAAQSATDPVNGKRYVDPSGATLAEMRQPVDGQHVANVADVAAAAAAALAADQGYTGSFSYEPVAAVWEDTVANSLSEVLAYIPDPGEKWIDVDLSSHTMRAFVGTTVVYGPISVVNGARVTPTVLGVYHIYRKLSLHTMRGFNVDGTPYEQPDVPWISYFYSGYALHGAPYRSSFGYAASHGCVNLPVYAAKWIYDWAPIGTPVVTHY